MVNKKDTLFLLLALPRNNNVDVVSSVSFGVLSCHFYNYIVTVSTSYPKWLLLSECVWGGGGGGVLR